MKRLFAGFLFGIGAALGVLVVFSIWFYWIMPGMVVEHAYNDVAPRADWSPDSGRPVVQASQPMTDGALGYLGSHGAFTGGFDDFNYSILAAGDGVIEGKVTAAGRPVEGVRLRLNVNGSTKTQWAESGPDGVYAIAIPHGTYDVQGWELDSQSAHVALPGLIGSPSLSPMRSRVVVDDGENGLGPDFSFVTPVVKLGPEGRFDADEDLVISWEPYEGATAYRVQLFTQPIGQESGQIGTVFSYRALPRTEETELRLVEHDVQLEDGLAYTIAIYALDERNQTISQTARDLRGSDFVVQTRG